MKNAHIAVRCGFKGVGGPGANEVIAWKSNGREDSSLDPMWDYPIRWVMYDMTLQDVAIIPKMSSVYHWMEGGAALTKHLLRWKRKSERPTVGGPHSLRMATRLIPMPPSFDFSY